MFDRTSLLLGAAALALGAIAAIRPTSAEAETPRARPNVVYIMVDDLGYADLGYEGGDAKTPNIDRLAREGVRLDDFPAARR